MSDDLFTERAKAYGYRYGMDAHKRLGISRRRFKRYTEGGVTKDKSLREKIIRRGLTAQKRQLYYGAYRRRREDIEMERDYTKNPVAKAAYQKEIDDLDREFRSGNWETHLKEEGRMVSSRIGFADTDVKQEYQRIIQGGSIVRYN